MKIVIPTYRRDKQLTWSFLSKKVREETVFVCDARDARRLSFLGTINTMIVPESVRTIADKMAWIFQNIGEEKILLLDDDLRFSMHRDWDGTGKITVASETEIDHFFGQIDEMLSLYPAVGISCRQANYGGRDYDGKTKTWRHVEKDKVEKNGKLMYAIGYHVPTVLRECELNRIEYRADYDYILQLLRKGYENRCLLEFCVDQTYNNPGGCSEQRTVERNNEDADKLVALHPGLVRVVEKEYKGSLHRKECVVSWKKALGKL